MVSGCSSSVQCRKRQDKQIANPKLYIPGTSARRNGGCIHQMTLSSLWVKCLINGTAIISLYVSFCMLCQVYLRSSSVILWSRINSWVYPSPKWTWYCSNLGCSIWWCLFFALEEQKGLKQTAWIGLACLQSCYAKRCACGTERGEICRGSVLKAMLLCWYWPDSHKYMTCCGPWVFVWGGQTSCVKSQWSL